MPVRETRVAKKPFQRNFKLDRRTKRMENAICFGTQNSLFFSSSSSIVEVTFYCCFRRIFGVCEMTNEGGKKACLLYNGTYIFTYSKRMENATCFGIITPCSFQTLSFIVKVTFSCYLGQIFGFCEMTNEGGKKA